ncbi:YfbU family protein [Bradyrhizobium sp. 1050_B9_N1_2]|uniref:YfbU family protein n=1 Tax=Bradyrhizobium sp. 1050_B9_N1_2 TaxID=3238688 RepID=UPI003EDC3063
MKLSDGEKLILLMLADMYKAMKVKGEFDPEFISRTIFDNQLWGFNWRFTGIPFERGDDPPAVTETANILDMWWFIQAAHQKLSAADKERLKKEAHPFGEDMQFPGFDANNEEHYGIARYLVEDLKRFTSVATRDFNSHMQSVPGYLRMYRVFEPMRATLHNRSLSADELIAILKERTHPDHR